MDDMKRMKLLVVDDDRESVELIRDFLEEEGYEEILTALSGEEALKIIESETPDLILLDIMMPRMSGYVFCQRVKENEKHKHIPVIMVTAKASSDDLKKSFQAGAMDYITKPVNAIELLVRVESSLTLKREQDRLRDALAHIKVLKGLLPICSNCKKIRDDKGYWNQIETYISEHTEVDFSHGICPECYSKLYGEFLEE